MPLTGIAYWPTDNVHSRHCRLYTAHNTRKYLHVVRASRAFKRGANRRVAWQTGGGATSARHTRNSRLLPSKLAL